MRSSLVALLVITASGCPSGGPTRPPASELPAAFTVHLVYADTISGAVSRTESWLTFRHGVLSAARRSTFDGERGFVHECAERFDPSSGRWINTLWDGDDVRSGRNLVPQPCVTGGIDEAHPNLTYLRQRDLARAIHSGNLPPLGPECEGWLEHRGRVCYELVAAPR